jgi:hypothetical protein
MKTQSLRLAWVHFWSLLGQGRKAPSNIVKAFISEVEGSEGYARNDVRARAKSWLISHGSSLDSATILLARDHFGYLLPAEWGLQSKASAVEN